MGHGNSRNVDFFGHGGREDLDELKKPIGVRNVLVVSHDRRLPHTLPEFCVKVLTVDVGTDTTSAAGHVLKKLTPRWVLRHDFDTSESHSREARECEI